MSTIDDILNLIDEALECWRCGGHMQASPRSGTCEPCRVFLADERTTLPAPEYPVNLVAEERGDRASMTVDGHERWADRSLVPVGQDEYQAWRHGAYDPVRDAHGDWLRANRNWLSDQSRLAHEPVAAFDVSRPDRTPTFEYRPWLDYGYTLSASGPDDRWLTQDWDEIPGLPLSRRAT